MKNIEHPFSWDALFRIVTVIFVILFIWKTGGILVMVIVSAMAAAALYPIVMKLSRRLPLFISTFIVIVMLVVPFIILGALVVPRFVREFPHLVHTVNRIVRSSEWIPPTLRNIDLNYYVQNSGSYVLRSTSIVTGAVTTIITILFLTFYFIYDATRLIALLLSIFPEDKRDRLVGLFSELAEVNGQYIRGNLVISIFCGVILYIGLLILNVPFAAPLAIFAAVTDLLPLVGSTIGLIPAIIIGFAISPLTALLVIVLYVIYQQFENGILAPAIYNKALNISPALSFVAVLLGSSLYGIVGAFLSLPLAASLPAIIKYAREETGNAGQKKYTEKELKRYKSG